MRQKAVKISLMAAMALLLTMANIAWSEVIQTQHTDTESYLYAQNMNEKAIGIRSGDSSSDGDFQVSFQPLKDVYQTGERIRFRIKGNRSFYLYLFSIDEEQNQGYMLLPNVKQQYNTYKANTEYEVPEKYVEFYSDQPGTEKIVMVASTKKLDVKIEKYTKSGDFFRSDSKSMEQDVKALRICPRGGKEEQKVVQELTLVITGEGRRSENIQPPPERERERDRIPYPPERERERDRVSTFLSSDKTDYRVGDIIKITFGADRKGYVHLFTVEPDGKRTFLKKQAVSGKEFYQVQARALQPSGQHTIVAIYGEDENLSKDMADMIKLGQRAKRLELIEDRPDSYAVYHLNVYE